MDIIAVPFKKHLLARGETLLSISQSSLKVSIIQPAAQMRNLGQTSSEPELFSLYRDAPPTLNPQAEGPETALRPKQDL